MTTEAQDRIDSGVLSLLAHASILKRLPRTGWLLNGVTPCESVADHTTGVALLTLALAGAINADWQRAGLARPIDAGRAVMLATLHDLAESVITDLPKRSAQLIGSAAKHGAETAAFTTILADLPAADDYATLWAEYDAASSPEARLVHDADALEMVHQAWQYARAGHRTLDEFWCGHRWHFGLCEHLFEVLQNLST
ncbi:MAG: HD family hydrolase [Caldilineaceae bacterium]|jgi:putative hydrolase of HD superfamily|nr:HD family hydrolase [Caldilineaceae bacterium]